ncbi:type II toxin-antitoxin system VapC family toxin [Cyanothece sp. BG0011]|uniref:type II toxin-antitoxin system VapC family toxin n=1 Tax=Cyanothece sp. BG0011 TaxID=2082950 RepID=UPI000D1FD636|nr:type II toxin-antitoxin system VapC family toxin [Cyanothece sp. BG0011]
MSYLVDTNILLRSADPSHPMFSIAINAMDVLLSQGENMYITPQNLIEFWNVATRPQEKNGLGYSISETQQEISRIKSILPLMLDTPAIFKQWETLVKTDQVKGVNVHDARLVAVMIVNKLSHILTFNVDDFRRYNSEITIVHPNEINS